MFKIKVKFINRHLRNINGKRFDELEFECQYTGGKFFMPSLGFGGGQVKLQPGNIYDLEVCEI